jgi:conjugal transfer pilus assembly protein TraE
VNLGDFLQSWHGTRRENQLSRLAILGLVVALILVVIDARRKQTVITLIPPNLPEAVELSAYDASDGYKAAWALHISQLLGNVKPHSAELVMQAIRPLLASSIHRAVMTALSKQVARIQKERIALVFEPERTAFEADTGKVFVTGKHTTAGPAKETETRQRTYEYVITVRNYRPVIEHIDVYRGGPRTRAARDRESQPEAVRE